MIYRLFYPLIWLFAYLLCLVLGPIWVRKEQKWPRGGLLVLSTHQSDCDPVFVQVGAMLPLHFMAKSELFEMRVLGPVIRFLRGFPVQRGTPDKAAIKRAIELLKSGERVGIFPEGQLSETGELLPVLPGSALIVRMAQVPVVCCRVQNTNRVIPYGQYIPRPCFRRVYVRFGEVRTFDKGATNEDIIEWVNREWRRLGE